MKTKAKPILHLNLKKKWFDMIFSGEKTEEYREMKTYWRHIFNDMFYSKGEGHQIKILIKKTYYHPKNIIIRFSNGYSKNRSQFDAECIDVKVDDGRAEWGAEKGKKYFVLKLGKISSKQHSEPHTKLIH